MWIGAGVPALLQQSGKEFLCEVLGVRGAEAMLADVSQHRLAVMRADGFQRRARLRLAAVATEDDTPLRGRETGHLRLRSGRRSGAPRRGTHVVVNGARGAASANDCYTMWNSVARASTGAKRGAAGVPQP